MITSATLYQATAEYKKYNANNRVRYTNNQKTTPAKIFYFIFFLVFFDLNNNTGRRGIICPLTLNLPGYPESFEDTGLVMHHSSVRVHYTYIGKILSLLDLSRGLSGRAGLIGVIMKDHTTVKEVPPDLKWKEFENGELKL